MAATDCDWVVKPWSLMSEDHHEGSCRACSERRLECDGHLPYCNTCAAANIPCDGYGITFEWPRKSSKAYTGGRLRPKSASPSSKAPSKPNPPTSFARASLAPSVSTLGLPEADNFLMQHYSKNLSRIAIAIDYNENGYRLLLQSGINDPCLVNSMLAVAASHYSKWQKTQDTESRPYLRKALLHLQARLKDPRLIYTEGTVVAMLLLVSYEIFNGTKGWFAHYQGILGWLAGRGDCSDLHPFIKTWVAMVDTQKALNIGGCTTPEVQRWLDSGSSWTGGDDAIDPFFGCSVRLPRLMAIVARLYNLSRLPPDTCPLSQGDIFDQAEELQRQIRETKIDLPSNPLLAVSCHGRSINLAAIEELNQKEYFRRMVAAAEIFRHAAHIYIHRIVHGPEESPTSAIQESIDEMFDLLAIIPNALGPGSNLGWCLTVLGAELDQPAQREYIRCRLSGIQTLGLNNSMSAIKVLESVWMQRDMRGQGSKGLQRWQDVMRNLNEGQVLI